MNDVEDERASHVTSMAEVCEGCQFGWAPAPLEGGGVRSGANSMPRVCRPEGSSEFSPGRQVDERFVERAAERRGMAVREARVTHLRCSGFTERVVAAGSVDLGLTPRTGGRLVRRRDTD